MTSLWVDDLRNPPLGWAWAKTSAEAIGMLSRRRWDRMSLDHDLGGEDTARRVVLWLCEQDNPDAWPVEVFVHTQNPVGEQWLRGMVGRYAPHGTLQR